MRHGKSSALASPYYWMVTLRGLRLSDQLPLLFMGFALPILLGLAGGLLVQALGNPSNPFLGFPADTGGTPLLVGAAVVRAIDPDNTVKRWCATLLLVRLSRKKCQN